MLSIFLLLKNVFGWVGFKILNFNGIPCTTLVELNIYFAMCRMNCQHLLLLYRLLKSHYRFVPQMEMVFVLQSGKRIFFVFVKYEYLMDLADIVALYIDHYLPHYYT
jgi:hypothetical protein